MLSPQPTSPKSTSSSSPITSQAEREQALRDYKLTIEYKHLKQHAPGGVYLLPSFDDLRLFHGVIFVRRGPYMNGIFKFQLRLPAKYNDTNTWPVILFSSTVLNPHVNAKTGELDVQSAYATWDPHKHYLVTVLTFLKKIFYMKRDNFVAIDPESAANREALESALKDPVSYRKSIEACVKESHKNQFVADSSGQSMFSEEQVCHQVLRELLLQNVNNPASVSRSSVIEMVKEAENSKC